MKLLNRLKTFLCSTGNQLEPELCLSNETYFTKELHKTFKHEEEEKHLISVVHSGSNLSYLLADSGVLRVISAYECVSLSKVKQALSKDVYGQSDSVNIELLEGVDGKKLIQRLEQLIPLCIESVNNTKHNNANSYGKAEVENVSSEYMVNWQGVDGDQVVGSVQYYLNGSDLLVTVKKF